MSDVTCLQVNNLRELHEDPGARWLAQAGGSTQTILATWPEFSFLRPDLRSGKGRFVASLEEARAALDSGEEEYYLVDVFTAAVTVYKDYMSGGGGGHHCKYTYTHKGGGSREAIHLQSEIMNSYFICVQRTSSVVLRVFVARTIHHVASHHLYSRSISKIITPCNYPLIP